MDSREKHILIDRLIPRPRSISFHDGDDFILRNQCSVILQFPDGQEDAAKELLLSTFSRYWNIHPQLTMQPLTQPLTCDDAYAIRITPERLELTARHRDGLLNAMKTLRQLAEPQRGTREIKEYILQPADIQDAPVNQFRGIHLCVFPETSWTDLERRIRLAAYHKFNVAIIELWGVFPFQATPQLSWADKLIDRNKLLELVRLGRNLGIQLCPQFNILGHAAAARGGNGKHTILDRHPQLQPLFEPDGWTWCLSNPETRNILTQAVTELMEAFDNPPYVHIGCDEAINLATCRDCRRACLEDLLLSHLTHFHDLIRTRGARTIMWHDMLISPKSGPDFNLYYANASVDRNLKELLEKLPKDIIIADWQYGFPKPSPESPDPTWPTNQFFKDAGFNVLVCPWQNVNGIYGQGESARDRNLLGYLQTTWHECDNYPHIYAYWGHGAEAAWGAYQGQQPAYNMNLTFHYRQMFWDMNGNAYEDTGFDRLQLP